MKKSVLCFPPPGMLSAYFFLLLCLTSRLLSLFIGVNLWLLFAFSSIGYASPQLSNDVHFCLPLNLEDTQARDSIYAATKHALNLNVGEPRTVRMIYFLPNDRPFRQEVVDSMKVTIRQIQTFYAEQMQAHGHGYRPFPVEVDVRGEPLVHRVEGLYPDFHYVDNTSRAVLEEVRQKFDLFADNVYLVVVDNSIDAIGTDDGQTAGGVGAGGRNGGFGIVPGGFSFFVAAHELGHAFGLQHDFHDDTLIMSYGHDQRRSLSACHAEFLAVHPYFNANIPLKEEQPLTSELLSPRAYPTGTSSVPIRVRFSDSDGLHSAILFVETIAPHPAAGFPEVKACRRFGGQRVSIVQFDYDGVIPSDGGTSLSNPIEHPISVWAVDTNGDVGREAFNLIEMSQHYITSIEGHTDRVTSVAFSPDGRILASAAWDSTVKLWDVSTKQIIATFKHPARHGWVDAVAFSPNGEILASGSENVNLWNVSTKRNIALEHPTTLEHYREVNTVAFSPDGKMLAAAGPAGDKVSLWELAPLRMVATLPHGRYDLTIHSVAFSPDGQTLASGSQDGKIKLWNVSTRRNIATLEAHSESVFSVAFSPDGALLASAGITRDDNGDWDSQIKLWNVSTRRNIATLEEHSGWVRSVAFSPDGRTLASGSYDRTVRLWDIATRRNIETFQGHTRDVQSVAFSPDGTILASGAGGTLDGGRVLLWDVSKYAPVTTNAKVTIDLIGDGGTGNQADDGVRSGVVAGQGTKIAVEVFAKGVTTTLVGARIEFDFDNSVLDFVKAENRAFLFAIPEPMAINFGSTAPVKLSPAGFLARAEFTTVVDVTDKAFILGIKEVTLAESLSASDIITTTNVIEFNPAKPHLVYPGFQYEAVNIPSGGSASIHIEAMNFSPAVEVSFSVEVREGLPYHITYSQTGNVLTVTAAGAAIVKIAASDGTITTDPITIEFISPDTVVPTADFNGDGIVNIADFALFADRYGARQGDGIYEAKYDLDNNDVIGLSDFLIFINSFLGNGKVGGVVIPDANLRAAIETALGKANGADIAVADIAGLPTLNARNRNVRDLTGLESATSLRELDLSYNAVSDLAPLSNLTNLEYLSLYNNAVSDLAPLSNLTSLRELGLSYNAVSDLAPLSNLTNLRDLYLYGNAISDLAPLALNVGLDSGDYLSVVNNPLSTISISLYIPFLQARGVRVDF